MVSIKIKLKNRPTKVERVKKGGTHVRSCVIQHLEGSPHTRTSRLREGKVSFLCNTQACGWEFLVRSGRAIRVASVIWVGYVSQRSGSWIRIVGQSMDVARDTWTIYLPNTSPSTPRHMYSHRPTTFICSSVDTCLHHLSLRVRLQYGIFLDFDLFFILFYYLFKFS